MSLFSFGGIVGARGGNGGSGKSRHALGGDQFRDKNGEGFTRHLSAKNGNESRLVGNTEWEGRMVNGIFDGSKIYHFSSFIDPTQMGGECLECKSHGFNLYDGQEFCDTCNTPFDDFKVEFKVDESLEYDNGF